MSVDVNKITLIGRVSQLPKVAVRGKQSVANFSLATNYRYRSGEGKVKEIPQFHAISAWGPLANIVGKYVKKGEKLYIDGHVRYDKWKSSDGSSKNKTVVVADNMIFLSSKKKDQPEVKSLPVEDELDDIIEED